MFERKYWRAKHLEGPLDHALDKLVGSWIISSYGTNCPCLALWSIILISDKKYALPRPRTIQLRPRELNCD